jgi:hypothetical protein
MFMLIEYQTKNKEYMQYNGRLAITLGWQTSHDKPELERYIIITPLKTGEYTIREGMTSRCEGNCITFDHYTWRSRTTFDTTDMIKFTEREPIKPPAARKNRWGERPVYKWEWGKWYIDHYEREED